MIQLTDICLNFGERTIYNNLSWQVPDGSRVALVGGNGAGKTTLLRILLGDIEPDKGEVVIPKRANIGYLAQDLSEALDPTMKVGELFSVDKGHEFAARAGKVLKGLGFLVNRHVNEVLQRKTGEFSGGWKMRLQLARVLLSLEGDSSDLLLLDEPTNHLDTESMEWLESWLSVFRGTLITIAHDKRFLDKLCPNTAELSNGKITLWKGNYSYYEEESQKRRELLIQQKKAQESQIEKTEAFIERFRFKATKATQVQSRIKALEKIDVIQINTAPPAAHFRFPEASQSGYEVVSAEKLSKTYNIEEGGGERQRPLNVFSDVSFSITRGQKIALVGANGSGKSTLSRIISGNEAPTSGKVSLGHNVKCSFYLQESVQNLDYSKTIMEEISQHGKMDAAQKRNLLGAFLFCGDDIHKRISVLSGGEKSRLALLKVLLQDSNFLILDEPTNHLDAVTREIFQHALLEYSGTVLIVSHDRNFLDSLAVRVLEIRDGKLWDYPGNYSYFIDKRAAQMSQAEAGAKSANSINSTNSTNSIKTGQKINRNRKGGSEDNKALKRELKALEGKINSAEEQIRECDEQLCRPDSLDSSGIQELMQTRSRLSSELEDLFAQWENLMAAIE